MYTGTRRIVHISIEERPLLRWMTSFRGFRNTIAWAVQVTRIPMFICKHVQHTCCSDNMHKTWPHGKFRWAV